MFNRPLLLGALAMILAVSGTGAYCQQAPGVALISSRTRPAQGQAASSRQVASASGSIAIPLTRAEPTVVVKPKAVASTAKSTTATVAKPKVARSDEDDEAGRTQDIEIWLGEHVGRYGNYEFPILGGRPGHPTPTGAFQIEWKSRSWWSKQWDAEMPYACFFAGGSAIHQGSLSVESHGCVHVSESDAAKLFRLCREKKTRVMVYP